MKNAFFLLVAVVVFTLGSCSPKIYVSPEGKSLAGSHHTIAIAPPTVSIAARKKVDAEALKEQQKTESVNFQKEMYSWLLKRKMQNRITVDIQDIATTTTLLQRAGYYDDQPMTPAEICKALGVDGLITSNYALSKPMSDGGAIALGIVFGAWGPTNQTVVNVEIHDNGKEQMIWSYNHQAAGSIGSSPGQLVDVLMRNASKKMPYTIN
ncbi:hypothetical protein [Flavilitoribacter nigricans]|uniref:DUF4136 domain-containing protein n=1 Tax=Flavilitoribacter nigricans (strain ATCC 23147 / DSM 23189 / NBRC 102662 / NCIMB 1420 / SS-2) TaxID=1122177 RepID=A0A2D0NDU8_FLAN2|nr:hypothetical protein [Flavilitoribacter nigricans]PHN06550.1 hypothetical protein CRP01_09605 [Flavilitoribacter nigricans DSM 23189 = NBRC 102662]